MTNDQKKSEDIFKLSNQLKELVHNFFLDKRFQPWVQNLSNYDHSRWYNVIVEFDKSNSQIEDVKALGENIYSKFVFRCVPSPTWKKNGELIVLFSIANTGWTSTVNFQKSDS